MCVVTYRSLEVKLNEIKKIKKCNLVAVSDYITITKCQLFEKIFLILFQILFKNSPEYCFTVVSYYFVLEYLRAEISIFQMLGAGHIADL